MHMANFITNDEIKNAAQELENKYNPDYLTDEKKAKTKKKGQEIITWIIVFSIFAGVFIIVELFFA